MTALKQEHVRQVTNTIFSQLLHTTPMDVLGSWGISKLYATQLVRSIDGITVAMATLVMEVSGFNYQGKVFIALDEGSDYYRIYGESNGSTQEYQHDVGCEELGSVLDSMIETGEMTIDEYQFKVNNFISGL